MIFRICRKISKCPICLDAERIPRKRNFAAKFRRFPILHQVPDTSQPFPTKSPTPHNPSPPLHRLLFPVLVLSVFIQLPLEPAFYFCFHLLVGMLSSQAFLCCLSLGVCRFLLSHSLISAISLPVPLSAHLSNKQSIFPNHCCQDLGA